MRVLIAATLPISTGRQSDIGHFSHALFIEIFSRRYGAEFSSHFIEYFLTLLRRFLVASALFSLPLSSCAAISPPAKHTPLFSL